jgi:hypothetical protein
VPCDLSSPAGDWGANKRSSFYIASSPVYKYSPSGNPEAPFDHPPLLPPHRYLVKASPFRPDLCPPPLPGVRSLYDMAMASCLAHTDLSDLERDDGKALPAHVLADLKLAIQAQKQGGRQCDVCERHYLVPRCEWLEYWVVGTSDDVFGPMDVTDMSRANFERFLPF